ncbi:uncharacterized protein tbc1d10c [Anguilla anguilla]|uniref:uncharacterized protein tbc1d10c n=1 Tax=Anguilla anguilla TaxID=7936 RepID=UPI0015AA1E78|nr:uncharacterized protein tbc1d10c [Anguilla anguilla]
MEPMSTQVDPNSEDSSSSDNMSLLNIGLPASETDRFGFILGTGSTVGAEGPPPEVIRQRETKWLNIIGQWDHTLLKKTNKVKEQCRKGIPASLRARCWPLLCYATERRSKNRRLYQTLDSSPALQTWVDMIERDIDRQFPFHEMFLSRDGHGQQGLFRVLKAYTQFRPDEGYCQGQGPVAAVLLMIMPAEEAFWCLVQISEQYLPGYYSPLLEGVLFDAAMLSGVLHRVCPSAHRHLLKHGVEPLMFATDWLMCLYARHLPFSTLLRVWDLFFCYGVRVLFQVAVVLVRRALGRQVQREECEGQMETLERLRGIKAQVPPEDDTFIEEVCSVPLSGRDLERETERELERWRKERPSSTFDPRNRCHGYQAAWVKGQEREEQQKRAERERGNLSLPPLRSPSSLSPSLLRKRWKRGSRGEAGKREVGEAGEREQGRQAGGKAGAAEKWGRGNGRERSRRSEREEEVQHNKAAHRDPLKCPFTSMAGNSAQTTDGLPHCATQQHSTRTAPNHGHTSTDQPQDGAGRSTNGDSTHAKPIPHTVVRPSPANQLAVSMETTLEYGIVEGSAMLSQTHTNFMEGPGGSAKPVTISRTSIYAQHSATETPSASSLVWGKTVESPESDLEQNDDVGLCQEKEDRLGGTDKQQIGSACNNLGIQELQGSNQQVLPSPRWVEQSEHLPVNHDGSLGNIPQGEQDSSGCSEGDISQQLEDSGNVELQGGHSGDTAQTGVPGNHSPAGDHPGPLTGQGLSQQGETESENLLSPSLLVERPKMEQAPKGGTEAGCERLPVVLLDQGEGTPVLDQEKGSPVLDQREGSTTAHQTEGPFVLHQVEDLPVAPVDQVEELHIISLLDEAEGLPVTPVLDQVEGLPDIPVLHEVDRFPVKPKLDQVEGLPITPVLDHSEESHAVDLVEGPPVLDKGEQSPVTPLLAQVEEAGSQQNVVSEPQLPTKALSFTEVIPFSSTHSEDSTVGPTSETLPGHTGGVSERLPCLPAQVGQTAQERDPHQEEAQPTGTDPTPPEGDLISPEDQSRSGQIPSPAGPCPIVEKGSGVYRPRRAPCGKASRSRTLSEDTFRDSNHTGSEATSIISPSNHTPQDIGKRDPSHQDKSSPFPSSNPVDTPRRFALFRMLRGDRSKDRKGGDGGEKNHKASSPKMTVPTILIQDFSDGVGPGVTGEGSGMDEAGSGMAMAEAASGVAGDGLSSKQRRRGRREQERREREEEKARKKREKVMEKEKDRERKKPQTRGKSFHAHSDIPRPGNSSCTTPGSKRNSAPFFDTIF